MRLFIFALSIFAITSTFAKEEEIDYLITYHPYYVPQAKKYSQGHLIENSQVMPGYNSPAKIDIGKELDVFASGTYLFYQPIEKGLSYAYSVNNPQFTIERFFEMHSNYKSAFKVALGFSTNYDDWVYTLEYSRIHFSKAKKVEQRAINTWIHFVTTPEVMTNTRAKWSSKIDILDLTFARPFYSGTYFLLTPLFGVKGGRIDQSFNTDSTRESDEAILYSRDKIDSYLIGLLGGAKTKLLIFWGFNFYTDVKASLFYQRFKVKNRQNSASDPTSLFDNSINIVRYINPNLLISSGFEWGSYFSNKSKHISFLVGYEANVFFNQNLMVELKDLQINNRTNDIGDLFFHGIVANLKINF
ncbi:MAG: hypothetical protein K1060chlam1_00721 [Candidatus Anoxychlamydiales bacterium]|nr:hypothetical protein [Candidatus Anoxychlamydiales bacterium]